MLFFSNFSASMARQEAMLGKEEMTKRMRMQQVRATVTAVVLCIGRQIAVVVVIMVYFNGIVVK